MPEFYWKQRRRYDEPDLYISNGGKIYGELSNVTGKTFDSVWVAHVWNDMDNRMIVIGRYIDDTVAKAAIQEYCRENYIKESKNEKILL